MVLSQRHCIYRLELGTLNRVFLKNIVDDQNPAPDLSSNKLIKNTLDYFENQVRAYGEIDRLVNYTQSLTFSLEFEVKDEELAIKAFESLNDRGKPLTLLDKTKSLLMFYSTRFLSGKLNHDINNNFGNIFMDYDIIKENGEIANIEYIKNPRYRFSEDELLRFYYHYYAKYSIIKCSLNSLNYDYTITTDNVFDQWLKQSCNLLKNSCIDTLNDFLAEMLSNFLLFVEAFKNLTEDAKNNTPLRKMLSFLGLSAAVYPLN